ncbi:MAG: integrin alpha [Anaerolineae bacterium]
MTRRISPFIYLAALLLAGFAHAAMPPGQEVAPAQLSFPWSFTGDQQGAELGAAVSGSGDLNGDGYADVVIGAPKYNTEAYRGGAAFAFYGSAAGLGLHPNWSAGSDQQGARFGGAVSSAGDVNGDGFDDLLVGAHRANNGQPEEGRAMLYLGSPDGLPATPAWHFDSDQAEAYLGYAVSGAGDLNGDGFDDVIIGAHLWDSGELLNTGAAFIFYGSAAGLPAAPGRILTGTQASGGFGAAVSSAGDVNGDGFDDVIIGAPLFNTPAAGDDSGKDAGAAYLYLGSAQGLADAPAWVAAGPHAGAEFGSAVGGAGDADRDGFADVIIGAPHYSGDESDSGAAFLYRGRAGGLPATPDTTLTGPHSQSRFGAAVAFAGDFNHDGFDELVIGAPGYNGDQSLEGGIFVYGGSTLAWVGEGNKAATDFGAAVASAGDVNGDGCADIVVGAPQYRIETDIRGRAFATHGQLTSLQADFFTFLPVIVKAGK